MKNEIEMSWNPATRELNGESEILAEIAATPWSDGEGPTLLFSNGESRVIYVGIKRMTGWRERKRDGVITGQIYAAGRPNRPATVVSGKTVNGDPITFIRVMLERERVSAPYVPVEKTEPAKPQPVSVAPVSILLVPRRMETLADAQWYQEQFNAPIPNHENLPRRCRPRL